MNYLARAFLHSMVLSSLFVHAHAQDVPITGKEIQESWVGKSALGTTANGAVVSMTLSADGTAALLVGSTNDSGNWRPWDNGYCTTWKTIRAGQERCFTVRRSGSRIAVLNPDGSVSGHFHEIK